MEKKQIKQKRDRVEITKLTHRADEEQKEIDDLRKEIQELKKKLESRS
ncbi:529_t:CDS:2 [Entrophospora sp. SA101]|nr:529_t:CDS:2 [Entrophospora sp. SA101]CAJ0911442.1 11017_t:CDS:2 [Entrophospora sp. SA101]